MFHLKEALKTVLLLLVRQLNCRRRNLLVAILLSKLT